MRGPVLEGLIADLLDPTISRTFQLMLRDPRNLVPEAPEEIQGQDLRVEYISVLAQAQRAVGIGGVERLWGFAGNLAQMNPAVLDKLDMHQTIDEYAELAGLSPTMVLDDSRVALIRAQRAQAQQQQMQMAQAREAAEQTKILSDAKPDDESELAKMVGSPG